jgi:hypothetical protein
MSKTLAGLGKTYLDVARDETRLPQNRFLGTCRKIRRGLPEPARCRESNIRWFQDWPACMRVL